MAAAATDTTPSAENARTVIGVGMESPAYASPGETRSAGSSVTSRATTRFVPCTGITLANNQAR